MKSADLKRAAPRVAPAGSFAIVAARWHASVVDRLVEGARGALLKAGVPEERIHLHHAAGSFELPQTVQLLARSGRYRGIIPVGCIVRGETDHYDFLAPAVFAGLDQAGRSTGVAVSLAVLTVENLDQAMERAGGRHGNKGAEAAEAALELAHLLEEVPHGESFPRP